MIIMNYFHNFPSHPSRNYESIPSKNEFIHYGKFASEFEAARSYEKEQDYLKNLWYSVGRDSDDAFVDNGTDSVDDDGDNVSVNSVHSVSKNSVGNEQVTYKIDENNHAILMAKDNITKWFKHHSPTRVRMRAENWIRKLPTPKKHSEDTETPLQCWSSLFEKQF
ncbi:hypothetical protein JTB14_037818 [Gonioctena quinquepunctata]|nr:hypothetical protein JTB14_037818 [Gonioctena quinquepunctata]